MRRKKKIIAQTRFNLFELKSKLLTGKFLVIKMPKVNEQNILTQLI